MHTVCAKCFYVFLRKLYATNKLSKSPKLVQGGIDGLKTEQGFKTFHC